MSIKVTVTSAADVVLADLGGRTLAGTTPGPAVTNYDLQTEFTYDEIVNSKSFYDALLSGDLTAVDANGKVIDVNSMRSGTPWSIDGPAADEVDYTPGGTTLVPSATDVKAALDGIDSAAKLFIDSKGQPGGLSSLDGSGKVPLVQLPASMLGDVNYQGTWNAATNVPPIPAAAMPKDTFTSATAGNPLTAVGGPVLVGHTLVITGGPNAGSYTITGVTAAGLQFAFGAFPSAPTTGETFAVTEVPAFAGTDGVTARSAGNKGWYYVVGTPGTTLIDGINDWKLGDWIISNGTAWEKVDNTDAVTSVNTKTGAVVLDDVDIAYTRPDGNKINIAAASDNVKLALDNLDDAIGLLVATPTNYTPTPSAATVTGHLQGIDAALAATKTMVAIEVGRSVSNVKNIWLQGIASIFGNEAPFRLPLASTLKYVTVTFKTNVPNPTGGTDFTLEVHDITGTRPSGVPLAGSAAWSQDIDGVLGQTYAPTAITFAANKELAVFLRGPATGNGADNPHVTLWFEF